MTQYQENIRPMLIARISRRNITPGHQGGGPGGGPGGGSGGGPGGGPGRLNFIVLKCGGTVGSVSRETSFT